MLGTDLNKPIGAEMPEDENVFVDPAESEEIVEPRQGISLNLEWLKTPTGDGSIESRLDHPLNFAKSRGVAQIIRGAEGIFGSLNLAIIDIVLGALEVLKEKRAGGKAVA